MGTTGVFIYASQRSAEAKRHLSAILALAPAVYTSNSVIAKLLNPLEILSTVKKIESICRNISFCVAFLVIDE